MLHSCFSAVFVAVQEMLLARKSSASEIKQSDLVNKFHCAVI